MKQNLLRQALKKAFVPSLLLTMGMMLPATKAHAQLSSNPDKFLGNITTRYQMDAGNGVDPYYKLWNQVTPENESKWSSVEGTRGSYNWGCDTPFNYAKNHNFTYKFHAFIWGAQYPNWLSSLSIKDRYASIVKWFDAIKKKYPTLPLIDVVNEAVGMHQQGNPMMKESLGGEGKTGYDWLVKAFEMAYERFPESILIYNDYNSFQHDVDNYLTLVQTLRDYGAPIDAYGNQSHDVNDISKTTLQTVMEKQQKTLKMPMYITELDIDIANDAQQKAQYEKIFPLMWEAEYCAGVTIWGYIHGATWVDNSGIIKNGKDRPAMTWLREYMQTDAAKNAKSPYPGMKKEASIYIKPRDLKVAKGDVLPIMVRAKMATKTIEKVELYTGPNENSMELINTMTEEPYYTEYQVPTESTGWKQLKAVVTTTDGATYERWGRFNVLASTTLREPYNETVPVIPGTINVTEYDKGAAGVSYNNASRTETSTLKTGGWMEYTVDVEEDGLYAIDADVASTTTGATFHLSEYGFDNLTFYSDMIEVPRTASATDFRTMHCLLVKPLTKGRHILCLNIDKGGFYMKNLTFSRYEKNTDITVTLTSVVPATISVGDKTTITVNAKTKAENSTIASVSVYANDMLIGTMTEAPYTFDFEPSTKGSYSISAIATDSEGKMNQSTKKILKVNGKRLPYSGSPVSLPGTIQAENFDKGGEGLSFHDSDSNREGDTQYRTDGEGVDFVKGNGGTCLGYTAANEWYEYSVYVSETGKYEYDATVSSGTTNSGFSIGLVNGSSVIKLADVSVPQTGSNDWGTYKVVSGKLNRDMNMGNQILRITITGANCNIDKIAFRCVESAGIENVTLDDSQSSKTFNVAGQRVNSQYKGIVIKNGKKVVNK